MNVGLKDEEVSKKLFHNNTQNGMAMGGGSTRPCDTCAAKRARWFCAADGAYLCHACDTSVHTANSVASRHERVRLTPSSVRDGGLSMSWARKKTRSERRHDIALLPSLSLSKRNHGEAATAAPDLHRFLNSESDPFRLEIEDLNLACFISSGSHAGNGHHLCGGNSTSGSDNCEGADGEPPFSWLFDRVKVEERDGGHGRVEAEAEAGPEELFDLNIDLFDLGGDMEEGDGSKMENCYFNEEERKICLTLNYEDVLSAWSGRGSPWADEKTLPEDTSSQATRSMEYGVVPDLNLRSGSCGDHTEQVPVLARHCEGGRKYKNCVGREACVMRYREKRRTRLFSKRIRYQVRKLNAEKRPRMKGRFVKTAGDVLSDLGRNCLRN